MRRPVRISLVGVACFCLRVRTVSDAIDAMNPFAASGPKMAELLIQADRGDQARVAGQSRQGRKLCPGARRRRRIGLRCRRRREPSGSTTAPRLAHQCRPVAFRRRWQRRKTGGGGTPKGDVLAFAAQDGKPLLAGQGLQRSARRPAVATVCRAKRGETTGSVSWTSLTASANGFINVRRRRCLCAPLLRRFSPIAMFSDFPEVGRPGAQ